MSTLVLVEADSQSSNMAIHDKTEEPVYSTPKRMVREYFDTLDHLLSNDTVWTDQALAKKYSALVVIVAVTAVETFLNVFFRVLVETEAHKVHKEWIAFDIQKRISIEDKLKKWPVALFGKSVQFDQGPGQKFQGLKKRRNFLVHFIAEHETLRVADISFHGLADTSEYDRLTKEHAIEALDVAEAMVEEVLKLSGLVGEELSDATHRWTGKRFRGRSEGQATHASA